MYRDLHILSDLKMLRQHECALVPCQCATCKETKLFTKDVRLQFKFKECGTRQGRELQSQKMMVEAGSDIENVTLASSIPNSIVVDESKSLHL